MRPLVRRRAVSLALLVAGLFAGWVASAGADLPPLPTIPALPQVPTLPVLPAPPRAPQVPPAQVPQVPPVPPAPQPSLPIGGGSGGSSASGSGSGASSQAPAGQAGSAPARIYRLYFSRNWISRSGRKRQKQTLLVFTLRKAGLVEFVVFQVAPDCRRIGRFRVAGRAGVNRVRFRGRVGRKVLGPGTYRIKARVLPAGRALVDTKLVVVRQPARAEIASARSANACGSGSQGSTSSASSSAAGKPSSGGPASPSRSKAEPTTPSARAHGVLGAKFTKKAILDAIKGIPPWLYALLGLAIALLAVAALPLRATPSRGTAVALAHHRGAVALGGAAMLVAVTIAYAMH